MEGRLELIKLTTRTCLPLFRAYLFRTNYLGARTRGLTHVAPNTHGENEAPTLTVGDKAAIYEKVLKNLIYDVSEVLLMQAILNRKVTRSTRQAGRAKVDPETMFGEIKIFQALKQMLLMLMSITEHHNGMRLVGFNHISYYYAVGWL